MRSFSVFDTPLLCALSPRQAAASIFSQDHCPKQAPYHRTPVTPLSSTFEKDSSKTQGGRMRLSGSHRTSPLCMENPSFKCEMSQLPLPPPPVGRGGRSGDCSASWCCDSTNGVAQAQDRKTEKIRDNNECMQPGLATLLK